jgi:hypothetical protein
MNLSKSVSCRGETCCLKEGLIPWQVSWLRNKRARSLQLDHLCHPNLWINVKSMMSLLILGFRLPIWIQGEISIPRSHLITRVYMLLLDSMGDSVLIWSKSLIFVNVIIGKL